MPTNTRKIYILDTSVLLANGKRALFAFGKHEVVLPLAVVKELEGKKEDPLIGFVARSVLNELDAIQTKHGIKALGNGALINGEDEGILRIEMNHITQDDLPPTIKHSNHDARIIAVAFNLDKEEDRDVTLISNDTPMRLLAGTVLDIKTEPFKISGTDQGAYTGIYEQELDYSITDKLYKGETLAASEIELPNNIGANASFVFKSGTSSVLAVKNGNSLRKARTEIDVAGTRGRNAEQKLALDHLLNPEIPVVSLGGPAGTGKSVIALAAGIQQTMEQNLYNKVVVFRPLAAVENQNLGYLPGTEAEKMAPWAQAVYDALDGFCKPNMVDEITNSGMLEVLPVTHIRGRTLHNAFVIIDEAQNLERLTLLSVLSRLGDNSKAVFSWDASQRDNLHIGRHDGIIPVVEILKSNKLFAHITLSKIERSPVANMATDALAQLGL